MRVWSRSAAGPHGDIRLPQHRRERVAHYQLDPRCYPYEARTPDGATLRSAPLPREEVSTTREVSPLRVWAMRRPVTERELLRGEHVVVGGDATVPFIGEAVDPPVALGVEEGKVSGERDNPIGVEWWLAGEIRAGEFNAVQAVEVHAASVGRRATAGDGSGAGRGVVDL